MKQLRSYTNEQYEKCKKEFLAGSSTVVVAETNGIPVRTVQYWCKTRKWKNERQEMMERSEARIGNDVSRMIEKKAREFVKKNISITEKLNDKVEKLIGETDNPYVLDRVASIAQKSHKIGSAVMGLDQPKKQGPTSIINVQIVASAVDNIKQATIEEIKRVREIRESEETQPLEIRPTEGVGGPEELHADSAGPEAEGPEEEVDGGGE